MRKSLLILLIAALCVTALPMLASGTAGTAADPLVTVAYARDTLFSYINKAVSAAADVLGLEKAEKLESEADAYLKEQLVEKVSAAVIDELETRRAETGEWREVTLAEGDIVSGPVGAGMMLTGGSAATTGTAELIDITHGRSAALGTVVAPDTYYMVSLQHSAGIRITSPTATVRLRDAASVTYAVRPLYEDEADRLNAIGLFRGSNRGYELTRRPTRQESLIMLIRLLGEEDAALAYTGKSTFTDLSGWPDGIKYVAYGQHKKYTNGISATEFAQQIPAESNVYFTYVLRALGYNDAAGDFTYRAAMEKAIEVGLITRAQYEQLKETGMLRDHMALISYNALWTRCKGSTQTLGQRLVERGVLTSAQLRLAKK